MIAATSPVLNVANLRELNSYDLTGMHRRGIALDELIVTHLSLVAELRKLDANEELICRMTVEGFTAEEIAAEIGCSPGTIYRHMQQLRWTLYGVDAADALAKVQASAGWDA